jgi:hypothetical protein
MSAGTPYFAWIDPGETVFGSEHLRWDEDVFSFTLKQDEGDPASLTLVVRRPRNDAGDAIGLLGPGRKIWAWFALDCGPDLIRFRGRLVGVPTSIFEELVTLEFVARPIDLVAQKAGLADSLRVLPYYDEVVIDPTQRSDPELVLEGYSKIWHYDRETHILTVSDEMTGEDGLVEFDGASEGGKVLYDGLGLTLTSGPLARVDVSAEYTWTQQAQGTVDLTKYLISNWPEHSGGCIVSYTFSADSWPKAGAGIGDGWVVAEATAMTPFDYSISSITSGSTLKIVFPDSSWFGPSSRTVSFTSTVTSFNEPPGSLTYGDPAVQNAQFTSKDNGPSDFGISSYIASSSNSFSQNFHVLVLHYTQPTLVAGYTANRQCTERVSFSLFADVQPVLTDPDDGEALTISDITSVNLSEPISDGTIPIGDLRRRSYIATERGNRSLEHLIALARAHLLQRSRVVEIAVAPKLARMPEITLRKSAFLIEPRVGEALGKIIGYSLALNGSDGRINCEVRIGCAIGHGGSAVTTAGTPVYCTVDYVGADYQQFNDRVVGFTPFDTSVGYQPPNADPDDDGINFLSTLRAEDVIAIPLTVENPASVQADRVVFLQYEEVSNVLAKFPTRATFKLKSMTRQFSSSYGLQVTDLKIPTGYNLEAI